MRDLETIKQNPFVAQGRDRRFQRRAGPYFNRSIQSGHEQHE